MPSPTLIRCTCARSSTLLHTTKKRSAAVTQSPVRTFSFAASSTTLAPKAAATSTSGKPLSTGSAPSPPPKSSCPPGTRLTGLNTLKDGTDPEALADEAYPAWLWGLLSERQVPKGSDEAMWKEKRGMKKSGRVAIKASNTLKG